MDIASLQVAIIAHLQWKSKLSDFFYGVEELTTAQVPNHTNCDFGKWLYLKGLKEFSAFPEMEVIEPLHQKIHEEINRLIQMPKAKRKSAGDTGFK